MTPDQIIKAVAELDEPHQKWEHILDPDCKTHVVGYRYPAHRGYIAAKPYLSSRDAIIPVIEKRVKGLNQMNKFLSSLCKKDFQFGMLLTEGEVFYLLTSTPAQLCEALLRATNRWIE